MISARRIVASTLAAAAMGCLSLAFAEDTFQAEVGLSYSQVKAGSSRVTISGPEASFFLDKVPAVPKDYPLEQARFVERTGVLSANFGRINSDIGNTRKNGSVSGLSFEYRRPNTPAFAGAGIQSSYSGNQVDLRLYEASVGAYVDKTTALAVDGSRIMTSTRISSGGSTFSELSDTFTSVRVSGQHLARLSSEDHFLFIAGISRDVHEHVGAAPEKNRNVFLRGTYYPTKMVGLKFGVAFDRADDPLAEGNTLEAGANIFLTPASSLDFDFQRFNAKASSNSDNFVTIRALLRF